MDSIMGNNTCVLADLPPGCKHLGCKWIFKRKLKVDGTIEKFKARLVIHNFRQKSRINYFDTYAPVDLTKKFLSSRFSIKDMGYADVILVSTPMDTSEKLMPNNGQAVSQLEYSKVIDCLMYAMIYTRPDIAFVVGKLRRYTSNPEGILYLLGGGANFWASKKQTCITSSTMRSEFVALAAVGKEAKWLRNLILEILLWSKPITLISILCDSAATLAKDYSQMYNGKSRHLNVKHSMIRELIMNGVISIEFVRSQQNLVDHLTKGLARDMVLKSAEMMGLKPNVVTEC
ncbi:zinc finger, CCHC-type containing protein [Tanacetum coccineum]